MGFNGLIKLSNGQEIKCPTDGIAYFPLPDCTKYLLCINGEATEIACPSELYYNEKLGNCDLPQNVPECIEGRRNVCKFYQM